MRGFRSQREQGAGPTSATQTHLGEATRKRLLQRTDISTRLKGPFSTGGKERWGEGGRGMRGRLVIPDGRRHRARPWRWGE